MKRLPPPAATPTYPRMSAHLIAAIAWAVILGGVGGLVTEIGPWYRNLKKPSWQPPDWAFGPAWTIILGLAAWAAVIAWSAAPDDAARTAIVIVYAVNFVFHFAWSPLFFKAHRPDLALIEVVFLWASTLAMIVAIDPISPFAARLLMPYLLWVTFAAVLNTAIVRLNPRPLSARERASRA